MEQAVVRAAEALQALLRTVDPALLTGEAAASLVGALATTEKVCAAVRARAAVRAVACEAHRALGFSDATDWLARLTGTSRPAARSCLGTASSLAALPATSAALDAGELSLAQAGEIASVAIDAPGSEGDLVAHARTHDLRSLQDRARSERMSAADPDELHRRRHAARAARHWRDREGMLHLHAELPPEVGLPLVHRLDVETDRIRREARRAGSTELRDAHAADALVRMLEGGGRGRANRADVVFVVDLRAWRRGHAHAGELSHVVGGGPLPVSVIRDLASDAFVKAVVHDGVALHTVAHLGRHIPAELRTALDLGPLPDLAGVSCTAPGCGRTTGLEWDHIQPNAARGPTSYDNLQPRCWPHHREKTQHDRSAGLIGPAPARAGPPSAGHAQGRAP
jgi:hypothetical protein